MHAAERVPELEGGVSASGEHTIWKAKTDFEVSPLW